jgi:hypothetical protein
MQGRNTSRDSGRRDKPRQRLQRTLRSLPTDAFSNGFGETMPQKKYLDVSPTPVEPQAKPTPSTEEASLPEIQYQCTSCDMMVSASDSYCPFCGAIFADGEADPEAVEAADDADEQAPAAEEPFVRPQKFDNLSMMKPRGGSRKMLYAEAMRGFTGSARLLEEIELLITDVSALGSDTTRARRLMSSAWEACREGDWPLVSALAKQTEDLMSPNIPDLVRRELGKARNLIVEAKSWGADTSKYMLTMKSAMSALHREDLDEALRLTKELMDSLRDDSSAWKDGGRSAKPSF